MRFIFLKHLFFMNREIKFRIFDPSINDFLNPKKFGFLADLSSPVYKNGFDKLNLSSNSEKCLISQFTGLHDKNGKEIYEGDVLKTKYQDKAIMIWHKEFACFCFETIDEVVKGEYQYSFKNVEIEVIGNIYENPELLDGSVVA